MGIRNPKPMHPGRVLASVFMADHDLNQTQLAEKLDCTPGKINEIVNGKRGISPAFALALESVFNLSASAWLRMQAEFDLALEREKQRQKTTKQTRKKKRSSGSGGEYSSSGSMAASGRNN